MNSVLHDYQYSVQVKSRFDLLLSDDVNNEDPDILIRKIHSNKKNNIKATKVNPEKNEQSEEKRLKITRKTDGKIGNDVASTNEVSHHVSNTVFVSDVRGNRSSNVNEDIRVNMESHTQKNDSSQRRGRGGADRSGFTESRPLGHERREFDRHSGSTVSSIKPKLKKEGYGHGNVGTIEDELEVEVGTTDEFLPDAVDENREQLPVENPTDFDNTPSEEPLKTITLKEYKEMKKSSKPVVQLSTKFNRQANDGKDVFSNMIPRNKPKTVSHKVEVPDIEEKIAEVQKPAFFEFERAASQRGRNNFERRFGGSERRRVDLAIQPELNSTVDAPPVHEDARKFERGGASNFRRGDSRPFERGGASNFQRGDSRPFERGGDSNFQRGDSRPFERSGASNFQRGDSRPFERGRYRNSESGFSRGGNRGFGRGGRENTTHIVGQKSDQDEQEFLKDLETEEPETNGSTIPNARGNYRGRGAPMRGRGQFQPRGGFRAPRGRFSYFEGPSNTFVQPPSMDSDLDFPSLK